MGGGGGGGGEREREKRGETSQTKKGCYVNREICLIEDCKFFFNLIKFFGTDF